MKRVDLQKVGWHTDNQPFEAAYCKAEWPSHDWWLTFAPFSSKRLTISAWPAELAKIKGVVSVSSLGSMGEPSSTNNVANLKLPPTEHQCSKILSFYKVYKIMGLDWGIKNKNLLTSSTFDNKDGSSSSLFLIKSKSPLCADSKIVFCLAIISLIICDVTSKIEFSNLLPI